LLTVTAKQEEFYHNKAEMREHGKKKGHQMDPYRLINISAVTSHLEISVFSFGPLVELPRFGHCKITQQFIQSTYELNSILIEILKN
jgi:hypothetical protein